MTKTQILFRPLFACLIGALLLLALIIALPRLAIANPTADVVIGTAQGDDFFVPKFVTIKTGDTVTFTNTGRGFHNVVFDPEVSTAPVPDGFTSDPASTAEWSKAITFDEPGTYYFFCEPHKPDMFSRLTVESDLQEEFYLPLIVR